MKTLKLTDDSNNYLELSSGLIDKEDKDVTSADFSIKWDNQESFFTVSEISDLKELIIWLERIKEKMSKELSQ